jgi:hypothetical protein
MHHHKTAYSKNGKNTIVAKVLYVNDMNSIKTGNILFLKTKVPVLKYKSGDGNTF